MTGARAVRRSMRWGLVLVAGAFAMQAMAQAPADLTGVYAKDRGELAVLQGDSESLVYFEAAFPQGPGSVGTCSCYLMLQQKKSPTEWTLRLGTDASDPWTLRIEPKQLSLQGSGAECCGAGWAGAASFPLADRQPAQSCKVKAARAWFHSADEQHTQRKAFVVAGDKVEIYVPAIQPEFVPARFKGPKASTVGMLKHAELDCRPQAATPALPAPTAADLKLLAGKWTRVEREGKGYILREYCDGATPSFELQPGGDIQMNHGQESEHLKLTGLKRGAAAGAYTLELTHDSGTKETLEWTVADEKKSVVRLKGAEPFRKGLLYMRDAEKAGIPTRREKCPEDP